MNIQGKTALITGGSRGIGRAIAIQLAQQGIKRLLLVAKDRQRLANVAMEIKAIGAEVITLALDLTKSSSISITIAQAWRRYQPIHMLVNCAGVLHQSTFIHSRPHKVEEEIRLNLIGMFTITRLVARRMAVQKEGTIINVSSLMGRVAAPTMATYSATKFAIVGFSRALRCELAAHDIRVIALLPTFTDTDMVSNLKLFRGVIPMAPEKVAQAMITGLNRGSSEILIGWQSYLFVWCQRICPWLLNRILVLTFPSV